MGVETQTYSGAARGRHANFLRGTRVAHLVADLRDGRDNPLAARLLDQARSQIEAQAAALHLPSIPSGLLDQMLSHAKQRLAQLSPSELARVGTGNALMTQIASESFGAVISTRDPAAIKSLFAAFAAAEKNGDKLDGSVDRSALLLQQRQLANYGTGRDGKASSDYRSELADRGIMENRALARSLGLGWAENTDLMRLKPWDLKALADSKISETTYRGLREMKFSDKGIVAMAEHAKKNGLDINKMYEKQKELGEIIGGGDAKKAEEYHRAIQQFFLDKKDGRTDAEERFRKNTGHLPSDEKGRKALEDTERLLKIKQDQALEEKQKLDEKASKKDATFDAMFDADTSKTEPTKKVEAPISVKAGEAVAAGTPAKSAEAKGGTTPAASNKVAAAKPASPVA